MTESFRGYEYGIVKVQSASSGEAIRSLGAADTSIVERPVALLQGVAVESAPELLELAQERLEIRFIGAVTSENDPEKASSDF